MTDGAITERRRDAIYELTDGAGFACRQIGFLTAYQGRQSVGFRRTFPHLAWGTLAWFVSEPAHIIALREDGAMEDREIWWRP